MRGFRAQLQLQAPQLTMYIPSRQIAQQRAPQEYGLSRGAARTTIGRRYQPYDGHVYVAHYRRSSCRSSDTIAQCVSAILGLFPSRGTDSP
jgi:hypothetical protein